MLTTGLDSPDGAGTVHYRRAGRGRPARPPRKPPDDPDLCRTERAVARPPGGRPMLIPREEDPLPRIAYDSSRSRWSDDAQPPKGSRWTAAGAATRRLFTRAQARRRGFMTGMSGRRVATADALLVGQCSSVDLWGAGARPPSRRDRVPVLARHSPCRSGRRRDRGLPRSRWRRFRPGLAGSQMPGQGLVSASPVRRRRRENETMYIGLGTIVIIVIIVLVILILRRRV
jgi:hypothetical protein